MFPHSNLVMYALYADRQREIEHILRLRRAAGLRSRHQNKAAHQVAHWVGERLITWGQQLQAQAPVTTKDAVAQSTLS